MIFKASHVTTLLAQYRRCSYLYEWLLWIDLEYLIVRGEKWIVTHLWMNQLFKKTTERACACVFECLSNVYFKPTVGCVSV